jgi:hypothetical protein
MAVLRGHPKRSPSLQARQGRVRSKTLAPRAVRSNIAFAGGLRQRDNDPPLRVESDLSDAMPVGNQELDDILRLLGGALDDILSGGGRE